MDLPRQITRTSSGILNFSTVVESTNEFGGIMHSFDFLVTKFVGLKFLGSTISEFTLVKILNSFEQALPESKGLDHFTLLDLRYNRQVIARIRA